jgi:hypothetical protein
MACKTVARHLFKQLPLTEAGAAALAPDDVEALDLEAEEDFNSISAATDLPPVDIAAIESGGAEPITGGDSPSSVAEPPAAPPEIPLAELASVVITDVESSHCGKTLEEIAALPRGKAWLKWCAENDKPESAEAALYLGLVEPE